MSNPNDDACPICNSKIIASCRCPRQDRKCENGHETHYSLYHRKWHVGPSNHSEDLESEHCCDEKVSVDEVALSERMLQEKFRKAKHFQLCLAVEDVYAVLNETTGDLEMPKLSSPISGLTNEKIADVPPGPVLDIWASKHITKQGFLIASEESPVYVANSDFKHKVATEGIYIDARARKHGVYSPIVAPFLPIGLLVPKFSTRLEDALTILKMMPNYDWRKDHYEDGGTVHIVSCWAKNYLQQFAHMSSSAPEAIVKTILKAAIHPDSPVTGQVFE